MTEQTACSTEHVESLMRENIALSQQLQQSRDLLTIANRRIGQHLDENVQLELQVMALKRDVEGARTNSTVFAPQPSTTEN